MAFLLRVSYVCKNAAAAVEVIRALRTMAAHQLDHPHRGVVVYLFARPDPLHRPCELEFFELYSNEASFWEHTMDREVRRAFLRGFDASNKHSVAWFSYGNMSALVRQTCIGFGSAFPRTEAGFILADAKRAASPLLGRVTDGSAAVLVRWLFTDLQDLDGNDRHVVVITTTTTSSNSHGTTTSTTTSKTAASSRASSPSRSPPPVARSSHKRSLSCSTTSAVLSSLPSSSVVVSAPIAFSSLAASTPAAVVGMARAPPSSSRVPPQSTPPPQSTTLPAPPPPPPVPSSTLLQQQAQPLPAATAYTTAASTARIAAASFGATLSSLSSTLHLSSVLSSLSRLAPNHHVAPPQPLQPTSTTQPSLPSTSDPPPAPATTTPSDVSTSSTSNAAAAAAAAIASTEPSTTTPSPSSAPNVDSTTPPAPTQPPIPTGPPPAAAVAAAAAVSAAASARATTPAVAAPTALPPPSVLLSQPLNHSGSSSGSSSSATSMSRSRALSFGSSEEIVSRTFTLVTALQQWSQVVGPLVFHVGRPFAHAVELIAVYRDHTALSSHVSHAMSQTVLRALPELCGRIDIDLYGPGKFVARDMLLASPMAEASRTIASTNVSASGQPAGSQEALSRQHHHPTSQRQLFQNYMNVTAPHSYRPYEEDHHDDDDDYDEEELHSASVLLRCIETEAGYVLHPQAVFE